MKITLTDPSLIEQLGGALGNDPLGYLFWVISLLTLIATIVLAVMFAMTVQEKGRGSVSPVRQGEVRHRM